MTYKQTNLHAISSTPGAHCARRLFCASILAFTLLAHANAQAGLVAAYGFNEGSGTSVNDISGNGNTGTITGATWSGSGKFGGALSFDGTSSLVTINDS